MNALSLHQPYASAMALGLKSIETRSWKPPASCVGERFAIASTKRWGPGWRNVWADPDRDDERLRRVDALIEQFGCPGVEDENGSYCITADTRGLPLGCIVASGVLVAVAPIEVAPDPVLSPGYDRPSHLCVREDGAGVALWNGRTLPEDIEPERAWGDFSPGRWAWLFSDVKRVEDRCPWCWDSNRGEVRRLSEALPPDLSAASVEAVEETIRATYRALASCDCPVCDGRGSCAPIPVKGKQRVWQWDAASNTQEEK